VFSTRRGGERCFGPAGHPLDDIEGDRGWETAPDVLCHRRVPLGVACQRLQCRTLVPASPSPAAPVERGGEGLLRGDLKADGDSTGRYALILHGAPRSTENDPAPLGKARYRLGSDRGSPNDGSTLFSKRVMAQIRSPVSVRT
jgi:hypothetical protein